MKRSCILLLLVAVFKLSHAQKIAVIEKGSTRRIPYPAITVLGQNYVFNAEKDGTFQVEGKTDMIDSLLLNRQGYELTKVKLSEVLKTRKIEMVRKSVPALKQEPLSGGTSSTSLNQFEPSKVYFFIGLEKLTERFTYLQVAQRFEAPVDGGYLTNVDIQRLVLKTDDGHIKNFEPLTQAKFILRIYEEDPVTGTPGKDLTDELIVVENKQDKFVRVNLKKYNIKIPGKRFYVGIEWLRIGYNSQSTKATKHGTIQLLYQPYTQLRLVMYQPFIGMSNVKGTSNNAWVLTKESLWKPYTYFMPDLTDFAISATLAY